MRSPLSFFTAAAVSLFACTYAHGADYAPNAVAFDKDIDMGTNTDRIEKKDLVMSFSNGTYKCGVIMYEVPPNSHATIAADTVRLLEQRTDAYGNTLPGSYYLRDSGGGTPPPLRARIDCSYAYGQALSVSSAEAALKSALGLKYLNTVKEYRIRYRQNQTDESAKPRPIENATPDPWKDMHQENYEHPAVAKPVDESISL